MPEKSFHKDPQSVGLHTIDVQGCFQRTSILRNEQTISMRDFKSKKGKRHLISRTHEKKKILGKDKLINATAGPPLRGELVLMPAYPRVNLSAKSTAAGEKLISPRFNAHQLIFERVKEICDRRIFLYVK